MDESKLPHSHTGGVRPMSIEGRFADERTRLSAEFTDADRAWRKKWLEDQHLSPNEPRHVPELERALKNPFRRFYRFPMDYIFGRLEPFLGPTATPALRWFVPKVLFIYVGGLVLMYNYKYNQHSWKRHSGLVFRFSRPVSLPGDPDWPRPADRTKPSDYADYGFKDREVLRN
ncbi:uncharacterized protein LOC144145688 [Haemaphysalis longicornis]|uniref:NADH dehydrogenase [ubiquinone] 1 beta subcomplex subunit 6 n=1 Tax=Haemaphysalis longicornis TaxID=44386 RepID=A0A9J6GEY8_HAELO|nr:hypothetical protein HPB48_018760 [Haemaphysalis longicornis]